VSATTKSLTPPAGVERFHEKPERSSSNICMIAKADRELKVFYRRCLMHILYILQRLVKKDSLMSVWSEWPNTLDFLLLVTY